jgi:hypothetical protein
MRQHRTRASRDGRIRNAGAARRARFGRPLLAALALASAAALPASLLAVPAVAGHGASAAHQSSAHARRAGASVITGVGDEHTAMFTSRYWKQLHLGITRYITPYDVVVHRRELNEARTWIIAATRAHQQILVAFYHSEQSPLRMPSAALYKKDVSKFLKMFPQIHQYQPWNEADRGYVPHLLQSPNPMQSAIYYRELRSVAHHDTVLGLDILDSYQIGPTLNYVNQFKGDIGKLRLPMPRVWGLHNYSDTNRYEASRTKEILNTVPGELWLTETGGVVQYGTDFTNKHGSGLSRAAHALEYMYKLAYFDARIKRLYIYDWTGAGPRARFDAGLMDVHGHPRKGYVVVCNHQLHYSKKCRVRTVND